MSAGARVALGDFPVTATAVEAVAFCKATGLGDEHASLPLTFPMRWLVTPAVRAALAVMVPEDDLILVHEAQMFDYLSRLAVGRLYTMSLTGRRKADPDQLIVEGSISAPDGTRLATLETILRLFSTRGRT